MLSHVPKCSSESGLVVSDIEVRPQMSSYLSQKHSAAKQTHSIFINKSTKTSYKLYDKYVTFPETTSQ